MKAQIVSFHCVLRNQLGRVISSTYNRDVITFLGESSYPLPGLVEGLQNLKRGQKRRISLTADQAFGFYDPELVNEVPRKSIPRGLELKVGDTIHAQINEGEIRMYSVVDSTMDSITLDANHPLAGQDLVFDIEATEVRDATPEEIAQSRSTPKDLLH